ncbi:MAG: PH domain-containing protein [Actinomycetota bacterium]
MIDLAVERRQSPLAVVFLALRTLRNIGLAQLAIIILFVVRGPFGGPLLVVPALLMLALGIVSAVAWWRYTFQLIDDELIVHKGILRDDRLTVPIDRIQSLAVEQELLHRITGLVKVQVDTAGSSDAEFTIDAIPRPVAEELERRAVTARVADAPAGDGVDEPAMSNTERTLVHHDTNRLLTAAVTASPLAGLVVLGPLLAALGQFGDDLPVDPPSVEADGVTWWWAPGAVLVALAFSVLLNLGRVFLQDWDLTLRAGPTSLRRTSGLLSRTSSASSIDRVQLLTTAQNPLQRHAGLRDVEVSTIGDGDLELVGLDDADVDEVRAAVGWGPERHLPLDRRVHPAEIWLATRNTTIVVGIAAGALGLVTGSGWAAVVLVVVPWKWWTTRRHVRNFRWSLTDALARTERVLSSATAQAAIHKANGVVVSQTIFERRRGLASVRLATAAGSIRIGMIPLGEAEAVRDVIVHAAETDRRPWM